MADSSWEDNKALDRIEEARLQRLWSSLAAFIAILFFAGFIPADYMLDRVGVVALGFICFIGGVTVSLKIVK